MSNMQRFILELERIVAEMKKTSPAPFSPAGGGRAPAPSSPPAGGDWVEHECKYWAIKPTQKGGTMGSFGTSVNGEKVYFKCFDEALLMKHDPSKGTRWLLKLKPWNDTFTIQDMKPADGGGDEEIPF